MTKKNLKLRNRKKQKNKIKGRSKTVLFYWITKDKKRAVVSDCSFFVNMLNMVFEH